MAPNLFTPLCIQSRVAPSHTDSGVGHMICCGQWDNSNCDISRDLKSFGIGACFLFLLLEPCSLHKKPELACWMIRKTGSSHHGHLIQQPTVTRVHDAILGHLITSLSASDCRGTSELSRGQKAAQVDLQTFFKNSFGNIYASSQKHSFLRQYE